MRIDTNSFNYFNPRSREGSDTESNAGLQYDRISIHAPAKGATTASVELSDNSIISIHAPAKGATVLVYVLQIGYENFNPRSREGSDMVIFKTRYRANKISIHAPAKGATIMGFKRAIDSPYFNPRSREGSDYNSRYCYCVANISIHAPAKGATMRRGRSRMVQ